MTVKEQAEKRRKENIAFIYKVCFGDIALRNKFFTEWKCVAETLANESDEMLSDAVIEAASDWLEIEGGY